ncbi:helix-turn-helix domain-containing protein [Streptomyces albus subsp. chlorinus]|uniref:helix-turn-helix domain-containing protein n=1 Tax=Streptomyces albus TaxID=1888 RepID=UPI00156F64BF|nr:helix-turn-helix domain-containing protein [Streptomyces albus]NSC21514.1 helix-turn-helix domain-containing protein [Streptomyces albus subsp. chlorinus]
MTDELLTVREVTAILKLGRTKVYDLIRTKELPSLTIGRSRRIPAQAVRAYLMSRMNVGEVA